MEIKKAGVSPPVNRSSIRDELDTSTLPDGRMFPDEETVAPPCDGLCNSTTSSGILFIGRGSPTDHGICSGMKGLHRYKKLKIRKLTKCYVMRLDIPAD